MVHLIDALHSCLTILPLEQAADKLKLCTKNRQPAQQSVIIGSMHIQQNVPLSAYSTMRLGGIAAYLAEINDRSEIAEALSWASERQLQVVMVGGGSNIFWSDNGFSGLVLVNKILHFETFEEDADNVYVTAGSGEVWDDVVGRTVEMGLSGIEQLSLVPGTVGGTPVQNVGAYGREIADVLTTVEAFDRQTGQLVIIPASDCGFGYRTSRFKTTDKGRFMITSVTLHLTRTPPQPPFYASLENYFNEHGVTTFTPQTIREAVITIRRQKLPDPATVPNNGSFFANPIISEADFSILVGSYPDIVCWHLDDGQVKLSAAWLVEQAGFKDTHNAETGMATWGKQSLVFVNEHATSTASLLRFKQQVLDAVKAKFGVQLQQEPEMIGQ
jgi:UDP-N-acetylmuramate dehydrogenase